MKAEQLSRLVGLLDAKKDRDAAVLAEIQRRISALDAEAAQIRAQIAAPIESAAFTDVAALDKWRDGRRRRLQEIAKRRADLLSQAEAPRAALKRSHGEAEAVRKLLEDAGEKR